MVSDCLFVLIMLIMINNYVSIELNKWDFFFRHTIAERLLAWLNPNCRINLYSLHMGPEISPTHCQCPFLRFVNCLFLFKILSLFFLFSCSKRFEQKFSLYRVILSKCHGCVHHHISKTWRVPSATLETRTTLELRATACHGFHGNTSSGTGEDFIDRITQQRQIPV